MDSCAAWITLYNSTLAYESHTHCCSVADVLFMYAQKTRSEKPIHAHICVLVGNVSYIFIQKSAYRVVARQWIPVIHCLKVVCVESAR